MSGSNWISLVGDILAVVAIVIAIVIFIKQKRLSNAQSAQSTALANLEITEKLGTISSRAERLAAVGVGETAQSLAGRTDTTSLDTRAQIMYAVYDCLALNEVYKNASPKYQQKYRDILAECWHTWQRVPLLHVARFGYKEGDEIYLARLFREQLEPCAIWPELYPIVPSPDPEERSGNVTTPQ